MADVDRFSVCCCDFPSEAPDRHGVELEFPGGPSVKMERETAACLIRSLALAVEGWSGSGLINLEGTGYTPEYFKGFYEREEEVHEEPTFYLAIHRAIELLEKKKSPG